jgi:hypothetical protein
MRDPANPNDPAGFEWFCLDCSFRPWADTGRPSCAEVTVVSTSGRAGRAKATERDGRWHADVALADGEVALVRPGGVRDGFGQINAAPSAVIGQGTPAARRRAAALADRATRCG